jgi:lactoylglutathione lyase
MEALMKAVFLNAAPYGDDAMNLPVHDVDAAIPFYEKTLGFRVVSRPDAPNKSVVLARDQVQIGLAENGGDPTQEGCVFEVDNLEAAFEEIQGVPATESDFRPNSFDGAPVRVFFVVAPDGLCYMLAQRKQ